MFNYKNLQIFIAGVITGAILFLVLSPISYVPKYIIESTQFLIDNNVYKCHITYKIN